MHHDWDSESRSPLAGAKGWLITDGKAGTEVHARGVADALGLDYVLHRVAPRPLYRALAPYGPVDGAERFGRTGSRFSPPWPAIAIAAGRASIPYIRALKRAAGSATYTVLLQDPKTGPGVADLIWVPQHDKLRGANVITTLTAPHSFTAARLAELRKSMPAQIAALPAPRVAVVLGGKNRVYKFTKDDDVRFSEALSAIRDLGASFMITPSRRSYKRLINTVETATQGAPRIFWDGSGENPFPQFLAHADVLVVTADSINMTGEACATGRPVYVFTPSRGSAKFGRFHKALNAYGATRPLPARLESLENWTYQPLFSAASIAREIASRWSRRAAMLSGPDRK